MRSSLFRHACIVFTSLFFLHLSVQAQVPGMILKPDAGRGYIIKQLADGNLIGLFQDGIVKMDAYGNDIWMTDDYDAFDIYENTDGSLTAFGSEEYYKLNSDGTYISSGSYGLGNTLYAVCRVPSGFQLLCNHSFGANYMYSRILDDGTELWSYELEYDNYPMKINMSRSGDNTQILFNMIDYMFGGNSVRLMLVDTLGTVLDDEILADVNFYGDVITADGGLVFTGFSYSGTDDLTLYKMDHMNEILWSSATYPESYDSLTVLTQLLSGNIVTALQQYDGTENYVLAYNTSDGEPLFVTPPFLDAAHYFISDMLYDEANNAMVFIGHKDWSEGFVLITDTLGNFVHMNVEGRVYEDLNENGVFDDDETTFHGIIVSSPPFYAVTDDEGYYSLFLPLEGSWPISAAYPAYWDIMDPSAGYSETLDLSTAGDTLTGDDFRMSYSVPIRDLVVSSYLGSWWYGYFIEGYASLNNYGNQYATSGTVTMHFPSELTVLYTEPPYDDLTDTIITWNFSDLDPYEYEGYYVSFDPLVDTSLIGDSVYTIVIAEPIAGDFVPEDNTDTMFGIITSSWDPNHKIVSPAGVTEEGNISPATEWLQYTIEFQNTGSSAAVNISIYDTLDSDISFNTLQMLSSSHNYSMHIVYPNIVRWDFENIYLPDSASDMAGSNGFLQFRIKINEGSPEGTVIKNTAAIYFDFNPAIITNTTVTTLKTAEPDAISENSVSSKPLSVYPNPAAGTFIMDIPAVSGAEKVFVTIKDNSGNLLYTEQLNATETQHAIRLPQTVADGIYMVSLRAGNEVYHAQIVMAK